MYVYISKVSHCIFVEIMTDMQPLQRQHSRTMTNAIVRECTIQILCRRDHAVSMCAETAIDEEGLTPPYADIRKYTHSCFFMCHFCVCFADFDTINCAKLYHLNDMCK